MIAVEREILILIFKILRHVVFLHAEGVAYCRVLVLTERVWSEERANVMTVGSTLVPWFIR